MLHIVDSFGKTLGAQVVIRADATFEPMTCDVSVAPVTNHVGMHFTLRSAGAALVLLLDVNTEDGVGDESQRIRQFFAA